jgi:hypothetical protein
MFSEQTVIVINISYIFFLSLILLVLAAATRMKGGAGWAALIMVAITVPAYSVPFALTMQPAPFVWIICAVVTLNVTFMPLLWIFVRSQLKKSFRPSWRTALHLIPAIVSLTVNVAYYSGLSGEDIAKDMELMLEGVDNMRHGYRISAENYRIPQSRFFQYIRLRRKPEYITETFPPPLTDT